MGEAALGDGRQDWERQWARRADEDFEWSLDDVAPQLRAVVERGPRRSGRSLDLGCGAGTSTSYLGTAFDSAVGVDIALPALLQATAKGPRPDTAFATADALLLPFPPSTFSFVYDRGCLQNLPKASWPAYFHEVDRVLRPGSEFVLLVSRLLPRFPPALSRRGLQQRYLWYVRRRRGGSQWLSHELLRRLCPAGLRLVSAEDFDFVTKKQKVRRFTHACFAKA